MCSLSLRDRERRTRVAQRLKVLSADFVTSAAAEGRADGIPRDGLAQVAFVGRSNVGKSTLINALARRKIARTSAAPGKTSGWPTSSASSKAGPAARDDGPSTSSICPAMANRPRRARLGGGTGGGRGFVFSLFSPPDRHP